MQEWKDFLILEPLAGEVDADLPSPNPPTSQMLPLACDDIFVQDVHDEVDATTNSSACFKSACAAKCTASAMASCVILPCHSSIMVSQSSPRATCSRTSATKTRVPRNVGWPWQTFGSATINRPRIFTVCVASMFCISSGTHCRV